MSDNVWGDIPTWIMAIATPVSIVIGFWIAKKQLKQNEKFEEQKFLFELEKKFNSPENLNVSAKIINEVYDHKPFTIHDKSSEEHLTNFLSDLEFVCMAYENGIISKKNLLESYAIVLDGIFKCQTVQKHIETIRIKMNNKNLWSTCERIIKKLNLEI